jgi:glycolate oxidase iron-sulfur subunit
VTTGVAGQAAQGTWDLGPPFSGADQPNREEILDCVHCGLCLPTCPTYLTTGLETASPRGRIYLMRAVEEGRAGISPAFVKHLDQCLGCLACQTACPSGVLYGRLLEAARAQVERSYQRPAGNRRRRRMLLSLFPRPERLGRLLRALYWYQRLGLARVIRGSGLLALASPRLAEMEALLPALPSPVEWRPLPELTPPGRARLGRIGFLTGCVQRFLLPGLNRATVRVLSAAGYEVVTPEQQGCCGALHLHGGDLDTGRAHARRLMETFERADVDLVAVNAAGCGAVMKEYGHLLRQDAAWRARAEAFSGRVRDVSQILSGAAWNGALRPVPLTVTYHEACHLAHGQRIRKEPRTILGRIPELQLVELPESDLCCGSAGVYNLLETEMAGRLLRRKVGRIRETGANVVAAANIGCLLQIGLGLRQAGLPVRAVHPVELLDWALHGVPTGPS